MELPVMPQLTVSTGHVLMWLACTRMPVNGETGSSDLLSSRATWGRRWRPQRCSARSASNGMSASGVCLRWFVLTQYGVHGYRHRQHFR